MGLAVEQVLAGPIVRRVESNRVAVWVALRAAVSKLDLTISIKGHGVPGTVVGHATCVPVQFDRGTAPTEPLVVQHALCAWDRTVVGQRGTADELLPDRPEPA